MSLSVPQANLRRQIYWPVFERVRSSFDVRDMPFLMDQLNTLQRRQPYQGMCFYHNIPLTQTTFIKIEALLRGGAEVIVSNVNVLDTDEHLLKQLKDAGIATDINKSLALKCDAYFDCLAEMISYPAPYLGYIELTQTGNERYKNAVLNKPVISIDDSPLKVLETIGTGQGFVQAMTGYAKFSLDKKDIVLFGYGKVGQGIHSALLNVARHITIIDRNEKTIRQLSSAGFSALSINDVDQIKHVIKKTDCVVTATGRQGLISQYFEPADFHDRCCFANMGAVDEYGDKFPKEMILFNKKPINFSIPEPTPLKYLDPIFYAHNSAVDYLIEVPNLKKHQAFPHDIAADIISAWEALHGVQLNQLLPLSTK